MESGESSKRQRSGVYLFNFQFRSGVSSDKTIFTVVGTTAVLFCLGQYPNVGKIVEIYGSQHILFVGLMF